MKESTSFSLKTFGILFAMFVAAVFLWNLPPMYPIKIFVVLLHELSHGLAALLTGGRIVKIAISPQIGGSCTTIGGFRILILMAGYLGSMLWGGVILLLASRTKADKAISIVIGVLVLAVTIIFVRTPFGLIFGILFGIAMVLVGYFVKEEINDLILRFLGLTSILYVIIDIKQDLIDRTVPGSDAYALSKIIPLPPVVWGAIWIVIALVLGFFFIKWSIKGEASIKK